MHCISHWFDAAAVAILSIVSEHAWNSSVIWIHSLQHLRQGRNVKGLPDLYWLQRRAPPVAFRIRDITTASGFRTPSSRNLSSHPTVVRTDQPLW